MSNSTIIDLCGDDQTAENVKRSTRGFEPVFDAMPSVCPKPISRQFWKAGCDDIEHGQGRKSENRKGQNRMHIHPMFLHSNATSHKWAFGAMAELLDNAVDEIQHGATFVGIDKISTSRDGRPALLIQDDGSGMDPDAIRRCMSFGFSDKKSKFTIGQYGNGFKTSSMRLGADAIVFSRHSKSRSVTQSVGLLSYTCLRCMGYDKIVVPMVDYKYNSSAGTYRPIIPYGEEHFSSNLAMLLQWSPYSTEEELLKQFDDIGDHGTKLVIYNLWLNDAGNLELDFDSDPQDICINSDTTFDRKKQTSGQHIGSLYQNSFRAYSSILYRMLPQDFRIILRGLDVGHYNIATDLKYIEFIKYIPHCVGTKEGEVITAIGFLKEAPRIKIHGFNIYHRNRLILPFWRVLNTTNNLGRGVVGVLEPGFIQPTHNKQDFETGSLFQKLEARLKQMTVEYWNKYCELIGYVKNRKKHHIALGDQESPTSRTQNRVGQPLLVTRGSQDETSRAFSGAVGSLEDPEVTTSDVPSSRLANSVDISVRSPEGFINKRKDRDAPVNLQNAKKRMASSGTDVQYINEQSGDSIENMMQVSEKIILMQENKRLRSQLLESERMVEELDLKVQQLRQELDDVQRHGEKLNDELIKICIETYV